MPGVPWLRIGLPVGRAVRADGGRRTRGDGSAHASRLARAQAAATSYSDLLQSRGALTLAGTPALPLRSERPESAGAGAGAAGAAGSSGRPATAHAARPSRRSSSVRLDETFPAEGERTRRVAFLAGCIANVSFARLNEATVRVLQSNGCEVVVPEGQGCCGALHLHAGLRERGAQTGPSQYRCDSGRRFRRHHHQRGGMRVDAEGIRRVARRSTRSTPRRRASSPA